MVGVKFNLKNNIFYYDNCIDKHRIVEHRTTIRKVKGRKTTVTKILEQKKPTLSPATLAIWTGELAFIHYQLDQGNNSMDEAIGYLEDQVSTQRTINSKLKEQISCIETGERYYYLALEHEKKYDEYIKQYRELVGV